MKAKSTISKELWSRIANTLKSNIYGSVKFGLDGHVITVRLARIDECELGYCVFIDGEMSVSWSADSDKLFPVAKKVCRLSVTRPFAKSINELKRQRGGKAILKSKEYAWIHETRERLLPWFKSVKSLVSQYSKISGLELFTPATELDDEKTC